MKKITKKLNYFTKVLLVIGLLFTNLSGLSVVFAYEGTNNFEVSVEDTDIKINYLSELEDTDSVKVDIVENYTYLDNTTETTLEKSITKTATEVESGLAIESPMLVSVLFDGLYELSVKLTNLTTEEDLGTITYSNNIVHEAGFSYKVYDKVTSTEITPVDGIYNVVGDVIIDYKLLAGGLSPSDEYTIDETTYEVADLIDETFKDERLFEGLLYGEYHDDLTVTAIDSNENEVVFTDDINYLYQTYSLNANDLNDISTTLGMDPKYYFESSAKDGHLYVYPSSDGKYSVNDLFKILDELVDETDKKYTIGNSEISDLEVSFTDYINSFDTDETETPLSMEEYFKEIYLDNSTIITIYNEGLSVTFRCIILGDMNDDQVIDEEDIKVLTDQIVGLEEPNLANGDIYYDEELNTLDAINLYQIYKDNEWELDLTDSTTNPEAALEVMSSDIVTGSEFTVNYIVSVVEETVSGIAGMINYDKSMLELVNVTTEREWLGNNNEGKFLYLGDEELSGEINLTDKSYSKKDYIVLTMTFRSLKAGTSTVQIDEAEIFNSNVMYNTEDLDIATTVTVNASGDNTLASLTVSGQKVALEYGVLDYEITVENENTSTDVEAIANNLGASISSIVSPEELAVGENDFTIVVKAENGDELIYTVKVIRKEAVKEETATNMNYQNNTPDEEPVDTPTNEPTDNEPLVDNPPVVKEESKLSRIITIILILLVIAGLIYLIFKDDEDDETKKVNKDIDKMKKSQTFTEPNVEKVNKPKKTVEHKEEKTVNTKNKSKKGR